MRELNQFTYGQRKGLGIAVGNPLYVVKIDAEDHTVWLGEEEHLYSSQMKVHNLSWLNQVIDGEKLRVKIRFQHRGVSARIERSKEEGPDEKFLVVFDEPQRSVTPGQAAVFYRDQQLLGGGWIE